MKEHRSRPPEGTTRTPPDDAPPAADTSAAGSSAFDTSPFETLGIAPTLDTRQVRRAYYALLEQFPPHKDPEGFGRLRKAYEQLSSPGSLALAYFSAPVDLDQEASRYEALYGQGRQEAAGRLEADLRQAQAEAEFVERLSRLPFGALPNQVTAGSKDQTS